MIRVRARQPGDRDKDRRFYVLCGRKSSNGFHRVIGSAIESAGDAQASWWPQALCSGNPRRDDASGHEAPRAL